MDKAVSIGIIGDFDPARPAHQAVMAALGHTAESLSVELDISWLPTESLLVPEQIQELEQYDGLWAAPGSPYQSLDGALRGIQYARETDRPFIGT